MNQLQRERMELCLREIDAWRASGLSLKQYVSGRAEELSHWRGRLSWERRWRQMLDGSYVACQRKPAVGLAFVRAVPKAAHGGALTAPPQSQDNVRIVLGRAGGLQASVEWPLARLGAASAWLRELLA